MSKITKAYILSHDSTLSAEYARIAAKSCSRVRLNFECVEGYSKRAYFDIKDSRMKKSQDKLWNQLSADIGKKISVNHYMDLGAACATAGHYLIWDKIAQGKETAIVLEHDAIMLHKPDIDIPDNCIAALGYKTTEPEKYNHIAEGPPTDLIDVPRHAGAHAYAITPQTAQNLLLEVEKFGVTEAIDNRYFMREYIRFQSNPEKITKISLKLASPICALGWLRKSTIWNDAASWNYELIESYQKYF